MGDAICRVSPASLVRAPLFDFRVQIWHGAFAHVDSIKLIARLEQWLQSANSPLTPARQNPSQRQSRLMGGGQINKDLRRLLVNRLRKLLAGERERGRGAPANQEGRQY